MPQVSEDSASLPPRKAAVACTNGTLRSASSQNRESIIHFDLSNVLGPAGPVTGLSGGFVVGRNYGNPGELIMSDISPGGSLDILLGDFLDGVYIVAGEVEVPGGMPIRPQVRGLAPAISVRVENCELRDWARTRISSCSVIPSSSNFSIS